MAPSATVATSYGDGAARFTAALKAAGISQRGLARLIVPTDGHTDPAAWERAVDKARQDINKIANGNRRIGPTMAKRIAPHLGVAPEDLLDPVPKRERVRSVEERLDQMEECLDQIEAGQRALLMALGVGADPAIRNAKATGATEEIVNPMQVIRDAARAILEASTRLSEGAAAPDSAAWLDRARSGPEPAESSRRPQR